ncbi:MAG: hypothetical protein HY738_11695 [Bacteroidia bacterium]|nr:hypothetical protein [Bacteroidia bacterium]
MKRKKNLHVHITLLICVILTSAKVYSTDYTYLTPSLALSNTSGCVTSTYTFSQKTPNNVNAAHNIDNTCTITFPAGTDATTCTGGTFYGTAIGSMTKTSTQISFTIPIAVAKNTTFTIVLNDITNANNNSSPCSISAQNASSGLNTGSYSFSTTSGPSAQATGFTSSAITSSSMTIDWTRGNGSSIIVVARAGSAVNVDPTDGNSYNANTVFGSGSQIGSGNYVVYNGTGTSVNVTGLSASTTYYYAIYEYNSSGYCYNPTELTGNETTSPVSTGGVTLNRPTFVKGTLTLTDGNIFR